MMRRERRFGEISSSTRKPFCLTLRILELIIQELPWADLCSLGAPTRKSAANYRLLLRISRAELGDNTSGEHRSHQAAHLGQL